MPEIKNTFLKGKMNKDLDARLLPNGEYRDAQNIHITKSEGSDTGVVQNIKGNSTIGSVNIQGKIIGYYVEKESKNNSGEPNDKSNRIFYFVAGNTAANNGIYYYDTSAFDIKINGSDYNFTTSPPKAIVSGSFLKFSENNLITGVNMIDELLFWTDNNNQPRKINVTTAIEDITHYDNEIKISVAKYYPYSAPLVFNNAETHTGMQISKTTATGNTSGASTTVTLTAANYDVFAGQLVEGTNIPAATYINSVTNDTTIVLTNTVNLTNEALTFTSEKKILEEEFVRFAYRFKFKDGEYSLISPFTQHCFIPKTYNSAISGHSNGLNITQLKEAIKSTELESMTNDVVQVQLKIQLPSNDVYNTHDIEKIEVLYKESDESIIKSVSLQHVYQDPTALSPAYITNISGTNYSFIYKSTLPYKTLTEKQLTRVYDNVPIKAKAQEITGNRLVYGNFEQNYDLPSIDFEARVDQKTATSQTNPIQNYHIQYPYHTIKQRRTYQVGLVLSDIYGRQSSVILPSNIEKSSVRVEAKDTSLNAQSWNGDALQIIFNGVIDNPYDAATRPLGWYSWKVVVKQTEQEYYTVYAPGALGNYPTTGIKILDGIGVTNHGADDERTWLTLHGDNINKIPRDITTNTQEDGVSASSTVLYPKIPNTSNSTGISNDGPIDVISIGTYREQSLVNESSTVAHTPGEPLNTLHESAKNHLVAELPDSLYGTLKTNLSVWETYPVESALDIYYETSTSGLVKELNDEILQAGGGPASVEIDGNSTDSFSESATTPHQIGSLTAKDSGGSVLSNITFQLLSVYAQSNLTTNIANKFDINNNYLRITQEKFYYGASGETYNVTIRATDTSNNYVDDTITLSLNNAAPFFTNLNATITHAHYKIGTVFTCQAENGSHDDSTPQDTLGLNYYIESVFEDPNGSNTNVTSSNLFSINQTTGVISNNSAFAISNIGTIYRINVKVLDAALDNSFKDNAYVDVEIGPKATSSFLHSVIFNGICSTTTSQQFFITRNPNNNASQSNLFEVGDIVYTTYSNGTLSNTYAGHIITGISGENGDIRTYAQLTGGSPGEVRLIGNIIDCSAGGP